MPREATTERVEPKKPFANFHGHPNLTYKIMGKIQPTMHIRETGRQGRLKKTTAFLLLAAFIVANQGGV